jgi:malic enzyme
MRMLAASKALAAVVGDHELNPAYIIPSVFNAEVHMRSPPRCAAPRVDQRTWSR